MRRTTLVLFAATGLLLAACETASSGEPDTTSPLADVQMSTDIVAGQGVDVVLRDERTPDVGPAQAADGQAALPDASSPEVTSDTATDGEPDVFEPYIEGATCRLVREWFENANGRLHCKLYEYDEAGNLTVIRDEPDCQDYDGDCFRQVWDEQGRELSHFTDQGCDGTPDSLCFEWEYDDAQHQKTQIDDYDCDGVADIQYTWTYDAMGHVLAERAFYGGEEGGDTSVCYEYSWDDAGNRTETRQDTDCDGTWDHCQVYSYDEQGRNESYHADDHCDGVPDRNCRTYEYGTNEGLPYGVQRLDHQCDGSELSCWTTVWNERGEEISREYDAGCDGEGEMCQTWEYDALGSLLQHTVAEPCSAEPVVCGESYTLDENGWEIARQEDEGCTGVARHCYETEYDYAGHPVLMRHDGFCDGFDRSCTHLRYDRYGNLVERSYPAGCNDDPDRFDRWEYECTDAP